MSTPSMATPGHTIGPFFHDALGWAVPETARVADGSVTIEGTVEDGSGEPLPAWLVEAWVPQAVESDRAAGSPAPGFRRLMNDGDGRFSLRVPLPAAGQPAAFITLCGVGLTRLFSTAVFLDAGESSALLDAVPAERRDTLVAQKSAEGSYHWTIRTQGERETVFLEFR